jgi:S-adenosylmethionine:tRNA ribosyltransferase-isomerase
MLVADLDFELPPELIAQTPAPQRAASRLLHYQRAGGAIAHRHFADLPQMLRPGDLLVLNDTRVLPARFTLRKDTGGLVEGLYLGPGPEGTWRVLLRGLGRVRPDRPLWFVGADLPPVYVRAKLADDGYELAVDAAGAGVAELLERVGRMPLPPYIRRARVSDEHDAEDRQRYQTVFARHEGSIAAPTAGLHFTPDLLAELAARGIQQTAVTLHVGLGTFQPVTVERIEDHPMHAEPYTIAEQTAAALNAAVAEGRRIIPVGTTACRVLESQPAGQPFTAHSAQTRLLIYPPYRWKHIGGLITNFHLPRSTLIALVAALVGLEEQRRIYATAIAERYRFFSYGDAMLVE